MVMGDLEFLTAMLISQGNSSFPNHGSFLSTTCRVCLCGCLSLISPSLLTVSILREEKKWKEETEMQLMACSYHI